MIKHYEKEIEMKDTIKFEMVGRACIWFAKTYPKNDECLWWKIPGAIETIVEESYRRGFADGAGIQEIDPRSPGEK